MAFVPKNKGALSVKLCLACAYVLLSPLAVQAPAQTKAISLIFDPTTPVTGTSVGLESVEATSPPREVVESFQVPTVTTQEGGKYILKVDTGSYHRDKFNRFSFDCYVKEGDGSSNSPFHRFIVWEEPIGSFPDLIGPVTVHIDGPNGAGVAKLQLPQHSEDSTNISVAVPANPYPVPMGHPSRMELGLSNNLSSLHVNLDPNINVVPTVCPSCWGPFTAKVIHTRLGLGQSTSLTIDIQPNSVEAFKRNWLVFDSGTTQELLVGTVNSESDEGGADVAKDFRIPVRYTPPGGFLLLSILCGVLIGCGIRFSMSKVNPPKQSPLEVGIAALTSLVAWLLLLGLYAIKTKATILGYDLDPTQVIPAGLITLLVAAGAPFAHSLAEVFGGKK